MLSDTTAPAEELQNKLAALEQLLLAYGRVAIGFSENIEPKHLLEAISYRSDET